MIIGISGQKGVGKDTLARYLQKNCYCQKFAFADVIKEIAKNYFNVPHYDLRASPEKKDTILTDWLWQEIPNSRKTGAMTVRELLQYIGTDLFRNNMHEDFWVKATMFKVKKSKVDVKIITDVRFPNEAKEIRDRGGIVVRLYRDTGKTDSHPSEQSFTKEDEHLLNVYKNHKGLQEVDAGVNCSFNYLAFNNGTLFNLAKIAKRLLKNTSLYKETPASAYL